MNGNLAGIDTSTIFEAERHGGDGQSAGRGGSAGINVIGQLPHVVHPPFLCDVYLADISNLKGLREILNVCLCIDKLPFV
jgi:hypothetical protein